MHHRCLNGHRLPTKHSSPSLCTAPLGWHLPSVVSTPIQRRKYTVCKVSQKSSAQTLYDLLGVDSGCNTAALKAAYRKLAAFYHPDNNSSKGAAEHFQILNQAYEVLRDDRLRGLYDAHGVRVLGNQFTQLKKYFSGQAGPTSPTGQKGEDVHVVVGLDFTESITGVERVVEARVQGACPTCNGSGRTRKLASESNCSVCQGSGEVMRSLWKGSGMRVTQLGACPACGGTGANQVARCAKCKGEGRSSVMRRVTVRIPSGVDNRSVLRLKGCGHLGRFGGESGDMLIRFRIHDEPEVERRGVHLYSTVRCEVWQALLGAAVPVRSPRGQRTLTIPQGSQHGDVLQLKHAGVAVPGKNGVEYGHHYVTLKIVLPNGDLLQEGTKSLLQLLDQTHQSSGSYDSLDSGSDDVQDDPYRSASHAGDTHTHDAVRGHMPEDGNGSENSTDVNENEVDGSAEVDSHDRHAHKRRHSGEGRGRTFRFDGDSLVID